ncbi:DUF3846 domain-containing protein [Bifidobacterium thermophilum]|uniref:DUF3846 domain-containing protein n=1 Tax=Bifidobacterium thermophilum TaxID=33905 RepID=UPI003F8E0D94
MKALKINQNSVRPITIKEQDGQASLEDLQKHVGGYIEPFSPLFKNITLYVNEDGMSQCEPNRLITATQHAAEILHVKPGTPLTVLYGDIIAIGFDPETGECRDLTDSEAQQVKDYFHTTAKPGSGMLVTLARRFA